MENPKQMYGSDVGDDAAATSLTVCQTVADLLMHDMIVDIIWL